MEEEYQEEVQAHGLLKNRLFRWEEIVIGGNLNAHIYANEKSSYIINNTMDRVHAFDTNGFSYDLGIGEPFEEGSYKNDLLDGLAYKLAFHGLNPFGNKVSLIRLEDNKTLKVTTANSRVFRLTYEKLRIFDAENVYDLPFETHKISKGFRVFDWFDVNQGTKHEVDFLTDHQSALVKNIRFYTTARVTGTHAFKDLVAESFLTEAQLHDIEYSDTYSRLKVLSMMKAAGIKGPLNGTDRNGRVVYRPLKINLSKREVIPVTEIKSMECGDIIVDGRTPEEILTAGT
jgi:hypothetical protein